MQVNGLHYFVPAAAATMAVTPDTPYEDIPTPDKLKPLFEPVKIGAFQLDTKVVYAPLTRCRAEGYIPADITAQYYSGERSGSSHLHVLPLRCCAAYPPADPGQRGQLTCPDCCLQCMCAYSRAAQLAVGFQRDPVLLRIPCIPFCTGTLVLSVARP